MGKIAGVILTPLKKIAVDNGDVFHAMNKGDIGFNGFGEVYFSNIKQGSVKAWKQHKKMTLNIIVPLGEIRFVLFDEISNTFQQINLSLDNYYRLTVPPMLWMGFQGMADNSMLVNIANIQHDPNEVNKKDLTEIKFNWSN